MRWLWNHCLPFFARHRRVRKSFVAAEPLELRCLLSPAFVEIVSQSEQAAPGMTIRGNSEGYFSAASSDGRYILFESNSNNLSNVPDPNGTYDVYVRDVAARTTTLVSVNLQGTRSANASSLPVAMSPNGRYVMFKSLATDLTSITDNNRGWNIFVRDLVEKKTTAVNVSVDGTRTIGGQNTPIGLSADGRYALFNSSSRDASPVPWSYGDTNVFVRDLVAQTTLVVSLNFQGTATGSDGHGYSRSEGVAISADGRYVLFESSAKDLTAQRFNNRNIYVRDLSTQQTTLVTINYDKTAESTGEHRAAALTPDGRRVLFYSQATDLTQTTDTNGLYDVFVRDLDARLTTLVTVNSTGSAASNRPTSPTEGSVPAAITPDGRYVVFQSASTDLTNIPDGNNTTDVFRRDLFSNRTDLVSFNQDNTATTSAFSSTSRNSISSNGRYVAFYSNATNVSEIPDAHPTTTDVFVRDLLAGRNILASVNESGTKTAYGDSELSAISADGRYVIFGSNAGDLTSVSVSGGPRDVYIAELDRSEFGAAVTASSTQISENAPSDTTIGTLNVRGADSSTIYLLFPGVGGQDNNYFTIEGNSLKSRATFDYEQRSSYSIRVRASNSSGIISYTTLTIQILDQPELQFFRAYNPIANYHFFTTSRAEFENAVAAGYQDESNSGPFAVVPDDALGARPIFRLYNLQTGRHYYTYNPGERDYLVNLVPAPTTGPDTRTVGWRYEKIDGYIFDAPRSATVEVYRLYNTDSGVHIYVYQADVRDAILAIEEEVNGVSTGRHPWQLHASFGFVYVVTPTNSRSRKSSGSAEGVATAAPGNADIPSATGSASLLPATSISGLIVDPQTSEPASEAFAAIPPVVTSAEPARARVRGSAVAAADLRLAEKLILARLTGLA